MVCFNSIDFAGMFEPIEVLAAFLKAIAVPLPYRPFDDFLNSFIVTSLFHNFFWESFDTLIDEITKTLEDSMDKELINAALSEYWQVEKRPLNQDILFSQKVHCPESLKDFDIIT